MIKGLEKGKTIGKDDSKGMQDDLQKLTETTTKKLDTLLKTKETDLLKV
jgi:ribosome recycling factor